ncbi:MAG: hypothetical protein U9Q88_02615 [Bacillota bacterium]|nr:hypothetical protein [Bacillota bacterium]
MQCPKCKEEALLQVDPGISPIMDDGADSLPEDTFLVLKYDCPKCGIIHMFYDYDRTETDDGDTIDETKRRGK